MSKSHRASYTLIFRTGESAMYCRPADRIRRFLVVCLFASSLFGCQFGPGARAAVVKRDYLEYGNSVRRFHAQDDFFDPEFASYLLGDSKLTKTLLRRISLVSEHDSAVIPYIIRLRAANADVTYAALRFLRWG